MKKYFLTIVVLIFSVFSLTRAQFIDSWELIYPGGGTLRAADSLNFGFFTPKPADQISRVILTYDGGLTWHESLKILPKDSFRFEMKEMIYFNKNNIMILADSVVHRGWDNLGNVILDYKTILLATTDGGKNWSTKSINNEWRSRPSTAFSMSDSLHGIIVQLPSKYNSSEISDQILYTNDGWNTYEKISTPESMKASYQAIYRYPNKIVTKTKGYNDLFITNDLGETWKVNEIPDSLMSPGQKFFFQTATNYFYIKDNLIYHTVNSGESWQIYYSHNEYVSNMSIINDSTIYIHAKHPVYTTNNGKNWLNYNNCYYYKRGWIITQILEYSKNNRIAKAAGIFKYDGKKTLKPPAIISPTTYFDLPLDFEIKWEAIDGANSYHIQVVENEGYLFDEPENAPIPNFDSTLFVNDSMLVDTTYKLIGTSYFKTYTARVRAKNDSMISPWLSKFWVTVNGTDVRSDNSNNYLLKLYPNPVSNRNNFNIDFKIINNSYIVIDIINNLGVKISEIYSKWIKSGNYTQQYTLPKNLPPGIYWLRLTINNKEQSIQPIILLE